MKRSLFLFVPSLVVGIGACGGTLQLDSDGGPPLPVGDEGTDPRPAVTAGEDGSDGETRDASADSGAGDRDVLAGDAGVCPSDGALGIAGDYVASGGAQYWLRKSATATTYTIVPSGPPMASAPPQLFRIRGICSTWLLLAGTDGSIERLDWATGDVALRICVRAAVSAGAAALLSIPDAGDSATGCAGAAWLSLAKVSQ